MVRPARFSWGIEVGQSKRRGEASASQRPASDVAHRQLGRRAALVLLGAAGVAAACGPWQRVGAERGPDPNRLVPRLFDAPTIYQGMGLFAAREPLPFVAGVRYLAGETPDSTLAVVALSLANKALSFRRAASVFEARYRVELSFRRGGQVARQVGQDQLVRVAAFTETQRADESVIFQRFLGLRPGTYTLVLSVRDRYGTGFNRVEGTVVVPRITRTGRPVLIPVYRAAPRPRRADLPDVVVNPRATIPYGADSLLLYTEAYGEADSSVFLLRVLSEEREVQEVWRDTAMLERRGEIASGVVSVAPERLPIGRITVELFDPTGGDTTRAPVLVTFSDQWVVANFDETLFLLRYFGQDAAIREMQDASTEQRLALWRAFWRATDPNPRTPENEAIEQYFDRLQEANQRFGEASDPGWLTDRGEVLITLGEPDEIFDSSSDLQARGRRFIRWTYIGERLTLDFVDESGFGRFRLTPASRADYQQTLSRLRRGG